MPWIWWRVQFYREEDFMATVGLSFIKTEALAACKAAVAGVKVEVTMAGGDKWDTGDGTKQRNFELKMEG